MLFICSILISLLALAIFAGALLLLDRYGKVAEIATEESANALAPSNAKELEELKEKIIDIERQAAEDLTNLQSGFKNDILQEVQYENELLREQTLRELKESVQKLTTPDNIQEIVTEGLNAPVQQELERINALKSDLVHGFEKEREKLFAEKQKHFLEFMSSKDTDFESWLDQSKNHLKEFLQEPSKLITSLDLDRVIGLDDVLAMSNGSIECYRHCTTEGVIRSKEMISPQGANPEKVLWMVVPQKDGDMGWLFLNPKKLKPLVRGNQQHLLPHYEKKKFIRMINPKNVDSDEATCCLFPARLKRIHTGEKGWKVQSPAELFLFPSFAHYVLNNR